MALSERHRLRADTSGFNEHTTLLAPLGPARKASARRRLRHTMGPDDRPPRGPVSRNRPISRQSGCDVESVAQPCRLTVAPRRVAVLEFCDTWWMAWCLRRRVRGCELVRISLLLTNTGREEAS